MPGTTLSRDLQSYQSALDRYRQQTRNFNHSINAYNESLVTDAAGNTYVRDAAGNIFKAAADTGNLSGASLPTGKTLGDYGSTQVESNKNYYLLRQNPTQQKAQVFNNVQMIQDEDGTTTYYRQVETGDPENPYRTESLAGPASQYRVVNQRQVQIGTDGETGQPIYGPRYDLSLDQSVYANKPGTFTATAPTNKPDPSLTQLRQLQGMTAADAERGLITDTINQKNREVF